MCKLAKTALTAPLYVSIAWSLIIGYQSITDEKQTMLSGDASTEQETSSITVNSEADATEQQVCQCKSGRKFNFLHGVSVACFLLAVFVFRFGNLISESMLTMPYKFVYAAMFMALGVVLFVLGCYSTRLPKQVSIVTQEYYPPEPRVLENEPFEDSEEEVQECCETPQKELTGEDESGVEMQTGDLGCEAVHWIKNYDVKRPRYMVDSQC